MCKKHLMFDIRQLAEIQFFRRVPFRQPKCQHSLLPAVNAATFQTNLPIEKARNYFVPFLCSNLARIKIYDENTKTSVYLKHLLKDARDNFPETFKKNGRE